MKYKMHTNNYLRAIAFFFSIVMFLFPEFVTRQNFLVRRFSNYEVCNRQSYRCYNFSLREVEFCISTEFMRGYWIATFSIVCATNIVLQLLGFSTNCLHVPPTIALSFNCIFICDMA